jgi:hypothetical protein
MKTCTKCGQEKPATPEFFYRRELGLRSECKACACARTRRYWQLWPEVNRRNSRDYARREATHRRIRKEFVLGIRAGT